MLDKVGTVSYAPGPGTVFALTPISLTYFVKDCVFFVANYLCPVYLSGLGFFTIEACYMGVRLDISITPLGIRWGSSLWYAFEAGT